MAEMLYLIHRQFARSHMSSRAYRAMATLAEAIAECDVMQKKYPDVRYSVQDIVTRKQVYPGLNGEA